jgi:predicted small secreted protein
MTDLVRYKEAKVRLRELIADAPNAESRTELMRASRYASRRIQILERQLGIGWPKMEDDEMLECVFEMEIVNREEPNMKEDREHKHPMLLVIVLAAIILMGLWAALMSGCQTMAGACRDVESAARYGHEHLSVDE